MAVRLLGLPDTAVRTLFAQPAAQFPMSGFQQNQGDLAVNRHGRGVSVSRLDALHPGTWRVVEVDRSQTVLDIHVPVHLGQIQDHVDVATCLSPDGQRVAVVVPDAAGFTALTGRWGTQLNGQQVKSPGRVIGCDVSSTAVAVAVAQPVDGHLSVYRLNGHDVQEQRSALPVDFGEFCTGTGVFISQGPLGAGEIRAGTPARRLTTAGGLAGCTAASSSIWTVDSEEISWLGPTR